MQKVLINHPMSADGRLNLDWDRGLSEFNGVEYKPELINYKNRYWDDRDELHEYLYDRTDMNDVYLEEYIDHLDVFDAIIICGV